MAKSSVYSVCGMCTVRCPIKVQVENGQVSFIGGQPPRSRHEERRMPPWCSRYGLNQ